MSHLKEVGCVNILTQHIQNVLEDLKTGEFTSLEKRNHHTDINIAV